jgi:hypothetical protein
MKRSTSKISTRDPSVTDETKDAMVSNNVSKAAASLKDDSDRAVERGSQAIARHASRKQFAITIRWLTIATLLFVALAIVGYIAYPNIAKLPWQKYLDRFDFRLQPDGQRVPDKSETNPDQTSRDDP